MPPSRCGRPCRPSPRSWPRAPWPSRTRCFATWWTPSAATPIRGLDATRAALEQRAIRAVFSGTEWLTAEQIGRLRDPDAKNPHGTANRWRAEGRVFALTKAGVLYHPRYAFDELLDPHPVVAQVLATLAGYSPYRVASWFESSNGHLGGARPRERVLVDAPGVLAAAARHVRAAEHG